jgi:hypothetical protein
MGGKVMPLRVAAIDRDHLVDAVRVPSRRIGVAKLQRYRRTALARPDEFTLGGRFVPRGR